MITDDDVWLVTMRGKLGYTCETRVSAAHALNEQDATTIAGWMFPELVMVSAVIEDRPRNVPP